jgi:prepilin-type processing-associated H-X9-DG protein
MELIAIVSAVALLTALLAPAVADVSRRGKDTICLQNLARIAQASIVYAARDPDEQAIPIHPQAYDPTVAAYLRRLIPSYVWGGKSGRGEVGADPLFWGTGNGKGPATRPLNKILYGDVFPDYSLNPGPGFANWKIDERLDLSVYRCPSDSGYTGLHWSSFKESKLTSYDHYGTSYAANILWIFRGSDSNCNGPCCQSNSPYLHALSDIVNPVQTIYYLENCGRYAFWADLPGQPSCGGSFETTVNGWHGQPWLFNAAFVDGHVEPIRLRGFGSPRLGHYPDGNYNNWHCVIVRGDEWQLDTLPLDPTDTSISCSTAPGNVE